MNATPLPPHPGTDEPEKPRVTASPLLTMVKATGLTSLLGALAGVALTVWWAQNASGDYLFFGVFSVLVCLILGAVFGALGSFGAMWALKRITGSARSASSLWSLAVYFAIPPVILASVLSSASFTRATAVGIIAIAIVLFLVGRLFVAPRLLGPAPRRRKVE